MKTYSLLAVLIVFTIFASFQCFTFSPRQGRFPEHEIEEFDITESTDYYQKWRPVMIKYGNQFKKFLANFKEKMVESGSMNEVWNYFVDNYSEYYYLYDKDFVEEMKVISMLTQVSFQDVFTFNFMYEIVAFNRSQHKMCTAILLKQKNGEIVHMKNLDFAIPEQLGQLSIQFNIWDNSRQNKLYSYHTNAGMIHGNSGIRYGGYSFTLNERNKGYQDQNLIDLVLGGWNIQRALTEGLKTATTYKEYVEKISSQKYISSFYVTIASANPDENGVLLQMGRDKMLYKEELTEDNWYIVQTNYDVDEIDEDHRRTFGENYLEQIGRSATGEDVKNLLHNYPMFNNSTITFAEMDPSKGHFKINSYW